MPPKQVHGKGRTLAEPSFAQSTLRAFTDKENRSVVTAVGLFAVRRPCLRTVVVGRHRWAIDAPLPIHSWTIGTSTDFIMQIGVTFLHSSWAEILLPA
jgi:hypothetical protein